MRGDETVRELRHPRRPCYLFIILILAWVGSRYSSVCRPGDVHRFRRDARCPGKKARAGGFPGAVPNRDDLSTGCRRLSRGPHLSRHSAARSEPEGDCGRFSQPLPLAQMEALDPDVIFLSPLHQEVRDHFAGQACRLIDLECRSMADLYRNLQTLGEIFDRQVQAKAIASEIQNELQHVAHKIEKIAPEKRRRVMRIMGREQMMTPGEDSFQNEFIRAAGGIPPQFGKKGQVVEVTLEEWQRFDPQVIYGCGGDREVARKFFAQPGWRDVAAVRTGRIHYFPCALTCRASVHTRRLRRLAGGNRLRGGIHRGEDADFRGQADPYQSPESSSDLCAIGKSGRNPYL